jgi:(5-formylfuran-3-yl)methyl phosphate synthase
MTGMLASVTSVDEARIALAAGVDIIDLKAPDKGALGALPIAVVREVVAAIGGACPVSATIGDQPLQPAPVLFSVRQMADAGVDYVKIGFFDGGDRSATLNALAAPASEGIKLIAVLFGDNQPDIACLDALAAAGFCGAMLDTQDKRRGSLLDCCEIDFLADFVAAARVRDLLCGLAGSLRDRDIDVLRPLAPDYLGFRGALCAGHRRTERLDEGAVREIKRLVAARSFDRVV